MRLDADREELARFLDALFRYADEGSYISWRAFGDGALKDVVFIESSRFEAGDAPLAPILDRAAELASRAAQHPRPAVFCPPIVTLSNPRGAKESDLANGLALSVECDNAATQARIVLEQLLGAATVVVASGGVDAAGEDKLHLHWRLAEPTSSPEEHARLKRARILATALVGGDATNVPAVHPIRWPGSWHRKGEPRLARIVALEETREIILSDALERLEGTAPESPRATVSTSGPAPTARHEAASGTEELVRQLMTGEHTHEPLVRLAMRSLLAGASDGYVVNMLKGLMQAIPESARGGEQRWQGAYNEIWRFVQDAREKIGTASSPAVPPVDPSRLEERLAAPAVVTARAPDVVREIPSELLNPPGVLGDIARYGVETAHKPVPIFAVQAALALGSVVCGRRYVTTRGNYSSLYFLNVAKSGTGKEHAKKTVERILEAAGATQLLAGASYTSGGAFFSALLEQPQHITIIDEFGKYLEAASSERNSSTTEVLTKLMEAFGRVDGRMASPVYSSMTKAKLERASAIQRPAITLLAMTTPSTFYESLHSRRVLDGFLNRFLIVEHQGDRTLSVVPTATEVPMTAIQWVQQILEPHGNLDLGPQIETVGRPQLVEVTSAAQEAAKRFEGEMLCLANRLDAESLGDMTIRAHELALRVALICGLADEPSSRIVTVSDMEWAITYVRFFLEQTIEALRTRMSDGPTARAQQVVLNAVRSAGAKGLTFGELYKIPAFKNTERRLRQDAIDSLQKANLIAQTIVQLGPSKRGHPRHAFVALDDSEAD